MSEHSADQAGPGFHESFVRAWLVLWRLGGPFGFPWAFRPRRKAMWGRSPTKPPSRSVAGAHDGGLHSAERASCRTYWGSHACRFKRGHAGPHECDCCKCDDHNANPLDSEGALCVAKAPYYGLATRFYGEDAARPEDANDHE